jgi:hypothetical protein
MQRKLEDYFKSFPNGKRLYYERRSRQYDNLSVAKTKIITPSNLIRSFAAIFLAEPHRTTRNYSGLLDKVGKEIFVEGHRVEPYYVSASAYYRVEYLFRNKFEGNYKPAPYHLVYAASLLHDATPFPLMNSHDMARRCDAFSEVLWDPDKADDLFSRGRSIIDAVTGGVIDRNQIRTQETTEKVKERCLAA